ncbi:MAG TPA: peptidoglycan-binding domain-containing protein [Myxococcaceae bacterium]
MTTVNPTSRPNIPALGNTATTTAATKPGPGQLGLGSKGPEVKELKTLLRDAGFYNGAINDEMGQQGIDALKKAKAELKLGGPADIAGPTTVNALKKAIASRASGSDFGAQLRSGNLSQTPIYLAIGLAEGTINKNGSPNQAWYSHGDPGNGKLNKGFGSYQVYQDPRGASLTPEQADRIQANRLAEQWPKIDQTLQKAGIPAGPVRDLVAANALDAWNQAPATHGGTYGLLNPQRLAELKKDLASGKNPTEAIVEWRANGYRTDSGNLDAPGLGNSWNRVVADQRRRAEAVGEGLRLRAGSSVPSSSGPSAYQPSTPTQAPVNIGNTPASGTGELLAHGAKGEEVSKLQELLNKAGANPPLAVDGDFGPATEAAVKNFQQRNNLASDGIVGPMTRESLQKTNSGSTPTTGSNGPLNAGTLGSVNSGQYTSSFEIKPGSKGPEVERLKKALKEAGFYNGAINQEMGPQGVEALKKAKAELKLGGAPDVAGEFTLKKIEEYAKARTSSGAVLGNGITVNTNHPSLQKLANSRLDNGPTGYCVATTLNNMERLGVPNFPGGTADDPNNPRGAMVRLLKTGNWESLPLPGAQQRTIRSPYGTVQAQVISADAYEKMAQAGKIPSGAIIFQTRHGWDYSGGSSGNDMGIVRNGGRNTHNYETMPPIIYGDAKEVVLLVPKGSIQRG